jgi:hypothetical protein
MISQAYTHACMYANTPVCVCARAHARARTHTHTHTQGKRVCVFPLLQFNLTQNFSESMLTIVSQEDDELQWQDVETSYTHHSAYHNIIKWYLICSSTFPVIQTMPVLQEGCNTVCLFKLVILSKNASQQLSHLQTAFSQSQSELSLPCHDHSWQ